MLEWLKGQASVRVGDRVATTVTIVAAHVFSYQESIAVSYPARLRCSFDPMPVARGMADTAGNVGETLPLAETVSHLTNTSGH